MFQIPQRQYWSCMGETVLKKSQYDNDSASARENNRNYADQLSRQQAQQQMRVTLPSQSQSPFVLSTPQQPQATPFQRFIQTFTQALARPFVMIQSVIANTAQQVGQAVAQTLQQVPGFIDKAMSQVLSFFFGYKKDTREEKEKRDRNDAGLLDIFGENDQFGANTANKVAQKENSGLGSGSRQ